MLALLLQPLLLAGDLLFDLALLAQPLALLALLLLLPGQHLLVVSSELEFAIRSRWYSGVTWIDMVLPKFWMVFTTLFSRSTAESSL